MDELPHSWLLITSYIAVNLGRRAVMLPLLPGLPRVKTRRRVGQSTAKLHY